jgi:hypothetical protein
MQYNGILRNICSNGNIQVDLQNNEINLNDEKKPHIFLDKGSANLS